jgi:hypothetical protein
VALRNGAPTLFINGQPHSGMSLALYNPRTDWMRDFANAGVNLFTIPSTPTFSSSCYYLSQEAWTGPDTYNFTQLDERMATTLAARPDAFIFPRLNLGAPPWWLEQNPDEICTFDAGSGTFEKCKEFGNVVPSWASQKYRAAVKEGLRRLVAHVETSSYADRIIGYHLASGTTEEWMFWGSNTGRFCDYSPPARLAFQAWARAKYKTVEAVRKAWGHQTLVFEVIDPPGADGRRGSGFGGLRHPKNDAVVMDYCLFLADLAADTMIDFSSFMKDITRREKTVGVFYGYLLEINGQRLQNAGHVALQRVLTCPDIDFVCSPSSYAARQVGGEGTSHFMAPHGSVKLHNKLWFDENDIQTSMSRIESGDQGKTDSIEKDMLQQDKELAQVLTHASGQWWFDVCRNRYDDPVLMGRIAEWMKAAELAKECDRSPVDEVALVIDPLSLPYLRANSAIGFHSLVGQMPDLRRCGAASAEYLIDDLPQLIRQKVLLLTTSYAPTPAQRQAIAAARRDGRVLVFCYAPGLYRDRKIDEAAMEELTGIRLKIQTVPASTITTLRSDHPFTRYANNRVCMSLWDDAYPAILPEDPQATVLGTLEDGRPSVVARKVGDSISVFCPAGPLPASFLRGIAEAAGAHIYVDTPDQVWVCRDLLGLCVKDGGTRTVRLPRLATIRDILTGEVFGTDTNTFTVEMAPFSTRLFQLQGRLR